MTVYLITGGSGFLGKHIVHTLLKYDNNLKEIRVYDRAIESDFPRASDKVVLIEADIRDCSSLLLACEGVNVVIHAASIVDVWYRTSDELLYDVNVNGTQNVINACIECNVTALVYTSSMEVVNPMVMGNEETASTLDLQNAMTYPKTKALAERLVIEAHMKPLKNGHRLRTCALRPVGIYGDGDNLIKEFYVMCVERDRVMVNGISDFVHHSRVYAGNVAWMHFLAAKALLKAWHIIGGHVFFCYDNTPELSYNAFNNLLLADFGFRTRRVPTCLLWVVATVNDAIRKTCKCVGSYTPMLNRYTLSVANTEFTINTDKAARYFQYTPLYNWRVSLGKTRNWVATFE